MIKKLLVPLLAVYLLTYTVGCSSSDVQEESDIAAAEDESFAEEGESDFAEGGEEYEEGEEGEEYAEGEESTESTEGEEVADQEMEGEEEALESGEEVAESDEFDEGVEGDETLAMEDGDEESEFPEDVADETELAEYTESPPSDESLFTANNAETAPALPETTPETSSETFAEPADDLFQNSSPVAVAPVNYAPLQKINDAPFERNGTLLNRVYISRKGDNLKSVSEKIFGADRSSDLKRWNPGLRNSPWVGAKVYYNSPRNPQDSSRMLTYYEDMGVPPQVHVTRDGDNIRELGRTLLGDGDGWKEIWSTNLDVASKGDLPAGIELKYWPETSAAAPVLADNSQQSIPPPFDPTTGGMPPTDPTMAGMNPPTDPTLSEPIQDPTTGGMSPTDPSMAGMNPSTDPTMGGMPPTDPTMAGMNPAMDPTMMPPQPVDPAAGTTAPPADPVAVQPPPMDADPVKKKAPATADIAAADDTTMLLAVVGVALLLLVGVFIIMRKNRARQIDLSQTQV